MFVRKCAREMWQTPTEKTIKKCFFSAEEKMCEDYILTSTNKCKYIVYNSFPLFLLTPIKNIFNHSKTWHENEFGSPQRTSFGSNIGMDPSSRGAELLPAWLTFTSQRNQFISKYVSPRKITTGYKSLGKLEICADTSRKWDELLNC